MQKKLEHILKTEIDPAFSQRARFILEEIDANKPHRLLEVGCGRGFYMYAASQFSYIKEIHGIDINQKYIDKAKQANHDPRVKLQKASIYSLPYPDNYFDFIIASEILEHLDSDANGLSELKRVLKKGGTLAITVPHERFPFLWDPLNWLLMAIFKTHINKNIWWLAGIWADHERLYTHESLYKLVTDAGFTVEQDNGVLTYCWPFSHFILYGIGKNMVERLHMKGFDRFNFNDTKQNSSLIADIFGLPSALLDQRFPSEVSMNIVMNARK